MGSVALQQHAPTARIPSSAAKRTLGQAREPVRIVDSARYRMVHPLSQNLVRRTGEATRQQNHPIRTAIPLCLQPAMMSCSAVYLCLGFVRLVYHLQDLLHGLRVVQFIHGTEPRRRSSALLLLLVQPRTTCTLLVHLLPLYLSFWLFSHVRPLSERSFSGVLMYIRVSPPASTDRIQNGHLNVRQRTCQAPSGFLAGRTQSRLADHIHVIARSAATKQSQFPAWEIASLRSP